MKDDNIKDRIIAALFAMCMTAYVAIVAVTMFDDMMQSIFIICGGILFMTSFAFVHVYFKLKYLEKRIRRGVK
jgi:hypothetical protein